MFFKNYKVSFIKDKVTISAWVYLWAFYPVPLIYISVFVIVPYCLDYCSFVVQSEVREPESKLIQLLWRTVWRFLKKLKIELPYDPSIPLLGIYPEQTIIQKESCTTMFIVAVFTIARSWKQPKCPSTGEWIKKMRYIYSMDYYSAIKRK